MTLSRFINYKNPGILYICMPERINDHRCLPQNTINIKTV